MTKTESVRSWDDETIWIKKNFVCFQNVHLSSYEYEGSCCSEHLHSCYPEQSKTTCKYNSHNIYFARIVTSNIVLELTIFTRFLCASKYRNNYERKVKDRKRSRAAHLRDINYKSYKCYTQGHCKTKIVPTDEDRIKKSSYRKMKIVPSRSSWEWKVKIQKIKSHCQNS